MNMFQWIKYNLFPVKYYKVTIGSYWCVMETKQHAMEVVDNDCEDCYQLESVWMTQRKFDAMEEFSGF